MPARARAPRQPSRYAGRSPGTSPDNRPRGRSAFAGTTRGFRMSGGESGPVGNRHTGRTTMFHRTRAASCAALTALAVTTVISTTPARAAARQRAVGTRNPAAAAAGWLARALVGSKHDHYVINVGGTSYVDDGLTADGVLSMDAAHMAQPAAQRMTA